MLVDFQLLQIKSDSVLAETPQFTVSTERGFLPRTDPLETLPAQFATLDSLLKRMPVTLPSGEPGLLSRGEFGQAVLDELTVIDVDNITDTAVLTALFRDYTFAASAYLLEPCDISMRQTGVYGLGREVLPKQLAIPLSKISFKLGAKPFMEYAMSYSLYNWKKTSPDAPLTFPNLELIRSFQNNPSETGFILVHVAMVAYSNHLVNATLNTLQSVSESNRESFDESLGKLLGAMKKINQVMETMWKRSKPTGYKDFRTFIMGTKNQPMFPNGVLYEGVSEEPQMFRGESGANDSIIPTCDNLLQLTKCMPSNPLTLILRDFRTYRPKHHNEWLQFVEDQATLLNVREFADGEISSSALYLAALDQVREFRARHWNFTKEYILKHSSHPVATGGSPIVTWLPNQLAVVLDAMNEVHKNIMDRGINETELVKVFTAKLDGEEFVDAEDVQEVLVSKLVKECGDRAVVQRRILTNEVAELGKKIGKDGIEAELGK